MDGSLADINQHTGGGACQNWAVLIVRSLMENETSTKIKNKIAKTEIFFSLHPPTHPPSPQCASLLSRRPGKLFARTPQFPPLQSDHIMVYSPHPPALKRVTPP